MLLGLQSWQPLTHDSKLFRKIGRQLLQVPTARGCQIPVPIGYHCRMSMHYTRLKEIPTCLRSLPMSWSKNRHISRSTVTNIVIHLVLVSIWAFLQQPMTKQCSDQIMKISLQTIKEMGAYKPAKLPEGYKAIGYHWILESKEDNKGGQFLKPISSHRGSSRYLVSTTGPYLHQLSNQSWYTFLLH